MGGGGQQGASPPPPALPSTPAPHAAATGAAGSGAGTELQGLLSGLCSLVQHFEVGSATPFPVSGWVPGQSGSSSMPSAITRSDVVAGQSPVEGVKFPVVPPVAAKPDATKDASKTTDTVRLADAAKCEVCMCFEGLLG